MTTPSIQIFVAKDGFGWSSDVMLGGETGGHVMVRISDGISPPITRGLYGNASGTGDVRDDGPKLDAILASNPDAIWVGPSSPITAEARAQVEEFFAFVQAAGELGLVPYSFNETNDAMNCSSFAQRCLNLAGVQYSDDVNWRPISFIDNVGVPGTYHIEGMDANYLLDAGDVSSNHVIAGGWADDVIGGGAYQDYLFGGSGADVIDGGPGADLLVGGGGDDWLGYTAANELSVSTTGDYGSSGNTYDGGTGSDHIFASTGADTIRFSSGDGADTVHLNGGADTVRLVDVSIADGDSRIDKVNSDLVLVFGDDSITLKEWFASADKMHLGVEEAGGYVGASALESLIDGFTSSIYGVQIDGNGWDNDIISLAGGARLQGGAGLDTYHVSHGDTINDSDHSGNIFVAGVELAGGTYTGTSEAGVQTYVNADGSVVYNWDLATGKLAATAGTNTVTIENFSASVTQDGTGTLSSGLGLALVRPAGTPTMLVLTQDADAATLTSRSEVHALAGHDAVIGSAYGDVIHGGSGNDVLNGAGGNDELLGGDGNDTLDGGHGADMLRGGAGDDVLGGAIGGDDQGWFQPYFGYRSPGAGNTYDGGAGSDALRGTSMADVYLFNLSDGHDTLTEAEVDRQPVGQIDVLRFGAGIAPADITAARSGLDLVLRHADGAHSITIAGWYNNAVGGAKYQLERVEFADGTVWSGAEVTTKGLNLSGTGDADTLTGVNNFSNVLDGGTGNDVITGGNQADTLRGGIGVDTLIGADGADLIEGGDDNDTLDGGRGADTLRGGAGDDVLGGAAGGDDQGWFKPYNGYQSPGAGNTYEGGAGNDTLRGTSMADLYLFNLGDGHDTLTEAEVGGQPTNQLDVVRFGPDILPADIEVTRNGVDLVLAHANGLDSITVKSWYTTTSSTANQIERVEFDDGTVWSNIDLTAWALVVTGTDSNDTLNGVGSFNDTLRGMDGNDVLNGGQGADVLEGGDGNDTLDGGRGADTLRGGAGDDILGGAVGSDDQGRFVAYVGYFSPGGGNTYDGGAGNDALRGSCMADLYLFNLGDGHDTLTEAEVQGQPSSQVDVLRFGAGITASDITPTRDGYDLVLRHTDGTHSITVVGWYNNAVGGTARQLERVEFADGTVWTGVEVTSKGLNLSGTSGADTMTGVNNFNNVMDGGAGADSVTGGNQADTLRGSEGFDTLTGADGADLLEGGDGNDSLDGGRGADTLRGGAGDDILGGAVGSDDQGRFVAYVGYFSPGGGNTYDGGAGNDALRGSCMADLYLFNLGDGHDTLTEAEVQGQPSGQVDVLRFGAGITASDIAALRSGNDLVLAHWNGVDAVTVKNWFASTTGTYQVERIEFSDGSWWSNADATAMAEAANSTAQSLFADSSETDSSASEFNYLLDAAAEDGRRVDVMFNEHVSESGSLPFGISAAPRGYGLDAPTASTEAVSVSDTVDFATVLPPGTFSLSNAALRPTGYQMDSSRLGMDEAFSLLKV